MEKTTTRICVLFPGIGYTCDRPLMYYAGRLARSLGYEVRPVPYGHFPEKVRGDAGRLRQSMELAREQAEVLLADVDWRAFEQVVFIGKSIGTAVATAYAEAHAVPARFVLLTPLAETFCFPCRGALAFHGTADPWAETQAIQAACRAQGIDLRLTEGANHSLETGDVMRDLAILRAAMDAIRTFLQAG